MMKVAMLLAVLGSTMFFAGCAKEKSESESKTEVTTPSGDTAEVKTETEVTTSPQ